MKVFVSYASDDAEAADAIAIALRNSGHHVFLDRDSLAAGKEYHDRLRDQIRQSDLFVFLISPAALAEGRYTLTELKFARERWPKPMGRIVPVMIKNTPVASIPAYLSSLNIIKPEGNVVAEVVSAIQEQRKSERFGRVAVYAGLGVAVLALGVGGVFGVGWLSQQAALRAQADACAIANELIQLKSPDQLSEAAIRQSSMCKAMAALQGGDPRERQVADLMADGDVEGALKLLETIASERPQTVEKWDRLATLAYWRDPDLAIRAREAALKVDPDHVESRIDLSGLHFAAGNREESSAQDTEIFARSRDPLALLYARFYLCADNPDPSQQRAEWACDSVETEDLRAVFQATRLDKEFAAELLSRMIAERLAALTGKLMSGAFGGDMAVAIAGFEKNIDDARYFYELLTAQAQSSGQKEALRLQIKDLEINAALISEVKTLMQATSPEEAERAAAGFAAKMRQMLDQLGALAAELDTLSQRYASPLVRLHRASVIGNEANQLMTLRNISRSDSAGDSEAIIAKMKESLSEFAAIHAEHPKIGVPQYVLMVAYMWEGLVDQGKHVEVGKELARHMLEWAMRLAEAEKNSATSRMVVLEAHYYGWKQFDGDEKAAAASKAKALVAELRPLPEVQQWIGRLDFMAASLERGGEPGSMSIRDLVQSDPSFHIPSTPDETPVSPAPAEPR